MSAARQPAVTWAQRESFLYVTIEVDDAKVDVLKIEDNKLHFQGSSKLEKFETTFEFFDEVVGDELQRVGNNTRYVEMTIPKKDIKWWPRLLKEKKVHWLKVDFGKWVDEDDDGAEEVLGGGGMGGDMGMGGGGMGGFDINQYMSQMQGAGGMGGGADFDGLGDDDDEEDDMPELEENEDEKKQSTPAAEAAAH